MIDIRPRFAARHLSLLARALGGGGEWGMRVMLGRGRASWPWVAGGGYLLLRWSGERLPTPSLDVDGSRAAEIVGFVPAGATQVDSYADAIWATSTIYHMAVVPVGHGGEPAAIDASRVVTRAIDGAGALVGLLPNAPAAVGATIAAGNVPIVSWAFSRANEAAAAAWFEVCASSGAAFDFASPAARVDFVVGQSRYLWRGAALSPGNERWYTVRAVTAGGVRSLIPRTGLCPSGSYTSVDLGQVPKIVTPPTPTAAVAAMHLEVA